MKIEDNEEEEEFSLDDLEKIDTFFLLAFITISLIIFFITIWAGYHAWRWYIVIPISGLFISTTRIFKSMVRNSIHEETAKLSPTDADEPLDTIGFKIPSNNGPETKSPQNFSKTRRLISRLPSPAIFLSVYIAMTFVAAFWYGLGLIARLGFS